MASCDCVPFDADEIGGLTYLDAGDAGFDDYDDDVGGFEPYGDFAAEDFDDDGEVDGILDDAWNAGKKIYNKLSGGGSKGKKKAQQRARQETRRAEQNRKRADDLEDRLAEQRRQNIRAREQAANRRRIEAKEREIEALRAQQATVRSRRERLAAAKRKKALKWGAGIAGAGAVAFGAWKLAQRQAAA